MTTPTWLETARAQLAKYDEAIDAAIDSESVSVGTNAIRHQRLEVLERRRAILASQIAQAEAEGAVATMQVRIL